MQPNNHCTFCCHIKQTFLLLLFLFLTAVAPAQVSYMLSGYNGELRRINITDCTATVINPCSSALTGSQLDIALDKKNNLYYVNGLGDLVVTNLASGSGCKKVASFGVPVNSLAADSTGKIYGAYNGLYVYDPVANTTTKLGNFPPGITAAGDLTFFNGQLYLAALSGIVKVDINNPGQSFLYMPLSIPNAFGIITVPANCTQYKTFVTSTNGVSSELYEIDMVNKKVIGSKCTWPFQILGAASITESGSNVPTPLTFDKLTVTPSCSGNNTGSLTVSASGAGVLTFGVDGAVPVLQTNFTLLSAGLHTLAVYDEAGCRKDTSAIIPFTTPIRYSLGTQNPTCFNTNDGKAEAAITSGTGSFEYSFDKGLYSKTPSINNLSPGMHQLTIRQDNFCLYDTSFTISKAAYPSVSIQKTPACLSSPSGHASVTVGNGAGPFQYRLDSNAFAGSFQFSGLSAGSHVLQIKDLKGCLYDTLFLINADSILFSLAIRGVECGDNGAISVVNPSAYGPFTYSLNNSAFQTNNIFSNLKKEQYRISVKDDYGCTKDTAVTIPENSYPCMDSLFFPTGFTPGNDGKNDRFRPFVHTPPDQYYLRIYNRWGGLIFESHDITKGWDGRWNGIYQPAGVYVCLSEYSYGNRKRQYAGTFVLIK